MPHDIFDCERPDQHCWSHDEDEPLDEPCYIACLECHHGYKSANELLIEHNIILKSMNISPEDNPEEVFTCPLCLHDF